MTAELPAHVREELRTVAVSLVASAVVGAACLAEAWVAWQESGGRLPEAEPE